MAAQITFRDASVSDAEFLYECRNDPLTRKMSCSKEIISFDDHQKWLVDNLEKTDSIIKIAEMNGESIGSVRAQKKEEVWILSWVLHDKWRGRNLAKPMVNKFVGTLDENLRAKIQISNTASVKIAEYIGLKCVGRDNDFYVFESD
ncbi:MAG: GNAT family N-acetyltransferase [Kiritimatiellia bacterium]